MKEILDIFRNGHHEFENGRMDKIPEDSAFWLFENWLKEAHVQEVEANAFQLGVVSAEGAPSSRIVYLKDILEESYIFYTNYLSDKGKAIEQNPNVSMSFFWPKTPVLAKKAKFWPKKYTFGQKRQFWPKPPVLAKKVCFWPK